MKELKDYKGVGPQTLKKLQQAGIARVQELLRYYPRNYQCVEEPVPISELEEDRVQVIRGRVSQKLVLRRARGLEIINGELEDSTGKISVVWYRMPYLVKTLLPGSEWYFRGKVVVKGKRKILQQPAIHKLEVYQQEIGTLIPEYPPVAGITSRFLRDLIGRCLEEQGIEDYLPEWIRSRYQLAHSSYALRQIHFPESAEALGIARKRLVFDEFFLFMLSVRKMREQITEIENSYKFIKRESVDRLLQWIPYHLTGAQEKTLQEVMTDMNGSCLMNRLIQGDVGSGKTIIAVLAMLYAADNGYQSVLMAPTEVLARQHYQSISQMIQEAELPVKTVLLIGNMKAASRREAEEMVASGDAQLVIGTHALIQDKVHYSRLALVITDEQHRFGVRQRELLSAKAVQDVSAQENLKQAVHVLVMSATPIPRTLAIIIYGDLDISVIDELPAGRLPIKNCVVGREYVARSWKFLVEEVRKGHQAYVICPMVEESDTIEAENVNAYARELAAAMPDGIRVGILHGKMKSAEKDQIMNEFMENQIQILVSTTVVEVGINVPNATVMMVENAERFGLAQLHQLRGRVGRSDQQSYCIFINHSDTRVSKERLAILARSNDGFYIASEDLKMRGPGDFYGLRQSGLQEFKLGDIYTDAAVLKQAGQAAGQLLETDPAFECEEHRGLRKRWEEYRNDTLCNLSL